MILYNVTVKIAVEVEADWLQWMREVHIPEVMATGIFEHSRLARLLHPEDEDPLGSTYSIQYTAPSMERLNFYFEQHAPALQKAHTERYKDRFVAFRSILEQI